MFWRHGLSGGNNGHPASVAPVVLTAGAVVVVTRRTVVTVVRAGAAVVLVVLGVVVVVSAGPAVAVVVVAAAAVVGIDRATAELGKWRPVAQPDRVAPTSAVAVSRALTFSRPRRLVTP